MKILFTLILNHLYIDRCVKRTLTIRCMMMAAVCRRFEQDRICSIVYKYLLPAFIWRRARRFSLPIASVHMSNHSPHSYSPSQFCPTSVMFSIILHARINVSLRKSFKNECQSIAICLSPTYMRIYFIETFISNYVVGLAISYILHNFHIYDWYFYNNFIFFHYFRNLEFLLKIYDNNIHDYDKGGLRLSKYRWAFHYLAFLSLVPFVL